MNTLVKSEEYKGYTIELHIDEFGADNPIDDCLGDSEAMIVSFHRRHGENHGFETPEEALKYAKDHKMTAYPIRGYEHGQFGFSLDGTAAGYPFDCPWDSGFYGFLLVNPESFADKKQAASLLKEYQSWVNGEVYGYVIADKEGEQLSSCWGFIGDSDYCLEAGKEAVDWLIEEKQKQAVELVETDKAWGGVYGD